MLKEALSYARSGVPVLPLDGKKPVASLAPHGVYSATLNTSLIERWWSVGRHNVGVAVPKGYLVLDVDPRNGGDGSLAQLEATFGRLPDTRAYTTGGGGYHLWYRFEGDRPRFRVPGIDLKGEGGYVVMPPSVHPETEARYSWLNNSAPVLLPSWLKDPSIATDDTRDDVHGVRLDIARSPLPSAAWQMLLTGVKTYGDNSRSGVFWSCAWYAVNAGWSVGEFMRLATDSRYPGVHAYYRKRGPRHVAAQYRWAMELRNRTRLSNLAWLNAVEAAVELVVLSAETSGVHPPDGGVGQVEAAGAVESFLGAAGG